MPIHTQLYTGNLICLGPIDHENDPAVAARWTDDSDYGRGLGSQPARPLSIARVKKKFEAIEKEMEEDKNCFYFTIRRRTADPAENDRLVGFARLSWIEWNIGVGRLQLGIGQADDRRRGYGFEALNLLVNYSFDELNLFALRAVIPEYNLAALNLFHKAGFVDEVRQRQEIQRDYRRWDLIHVGLLQPERIKPS